MADHAKTVHATSTHAIPEVYSVKHSLTCYSLKWSHTTINSRQPIEAHISSKKNASTCGNRLNRKQLYATRKLPTQCPMGIKNRHKARWTTSQSTE